MGKSSRRGGNNPEKWEHKDGYRTKSFTRIYVSMQESPAWLALTDSAIRQYLILRKQYKSGLRQTDGNGNAMIKCPYKSVQEAGIKSKETISNNFKQLEAFGFITIIGGGFHVASQYKFSDKWQEISDEEAEKIKAKLKAERNRAKNSSPPAPT